MNQQLDGNGTLDNDNVAIFVKQTYMPSGTITLRLGQLQAPYKHYIEPQVAVGRRSCEL